MASGGTSKADSGPWKGVQEYLKRHYKRGEKTIFKEDNLNLYDDSRVAGESAATGEYRQGIEDITAAGSPDLEGAQAYNRQVQSGEFLNNNPFRKAAFNADLDDMTRQFQQTVGQTYGGFEGAGRTSGYLQQYQQQQNTRAYSQEMFKARDRFYLQDYQKERGYQDQAADRGMQLSQAEFERLAPLGKIGQEKDQYSQKILDDLVQKFEYYQRLPVERLSMMGQALGTQPVMQSEQFAHNWGAVTCIAAAEYFDQDSQDWWDTALWINFHWPAKSEAGVKFLEWYKQHARILAAMIHDHAELKELLRPIFEWARDRGAEVRG